MRRLRPLGRPLDGLDAVAAGAVTLLLALADSWSRLNYRNIADDALISLRYAQQLVHGNGLVFNAGERVEGYTNFLWTIVLAGGVWLAERFAWDPVVVASAASALVAAAALVALYAVARRRFRGDALPVFAALGVCVADNAYSVWAIHGLEGPFLALWVLLSLLVWQGRARRRGLWLGLTLAGAWLTRPDAALFVGALLSVEAFDLWTRRRRDAPDRAAERELWQAALLCGAIYGVYFAGRYAYYGSPLPNTFYAKVGTGLEGWTRGLDYLLRFLVDRAGVPLLALLALIRIGSPFVRVLLGWLAAHTLYVVAIGGDFYPGHRFFVPVIPVIGLLLAEGLDAARRAPRPLRWAIAVSLVALLGAFGIWRGPIRTDILRWRDEIQRNRAFMTWLRDHSPPDATIAAGDIGAVGVFAQRRVLDFYGIVDPNVARGPVADAATRKVGHERTASLEYILERRPEYVKLGLLFVDFYPHGYYFDTSMPIELGVPGIWRRDRLPLEGRFGGDALLTDETSDPEGWVAEGEAFAEFPTTRGAHGERRFVLGQRGAYASSYGPRSGAAATGRLLSPPIELTGERLVFRVAGGYDPERLRVCLVVAGERLRCTTGFESIAFGRRVWDVSELRGERARLEIVDASRARNGIILVDEVRQWTPHREGGAASRPGPMPPGRWRPADPAVPATAAQAREREAARLQALGYLAGTEVPRNARGVTIHDPDRTRGGVNLVVSGHEPAAILMDMRGRTIHRWHMAFGEVWPERRVYPHDDFWRRVHVFDDGHLLAIWDGLGLVKLDAASRLVWSSEVAAHHDLEVLPDGDIVVLTRAVREIPRLAEGRLLVEDFVSVLSPEGRERRRVSLLEGLERSDRAGLLRETWARSRPRDPLHANAVHVLSGAHADLATWLRAGNVLTSFRELHMLAVLDPGAGRIVKAWTGDFRYPHDPRLLDTGRILFFDNNVRARGSRVVELDPLTGRETWVYEGATPGAFFSEFCGTAQRLEGGNTLVTESSRGRAFEVTRGGEVVWEYHSPHRAGEADELVASLLEVERLPADFGRAWRDGPDARTGPE